MPYDTEVEEAKGVPFPTPAQPVPAGTIHKEQKEGTVIPKLFTPLQIRGLKVQNRIGVSPMCMYSTNEKNEVTPFHLVHYGQFALKGPGVTLIEATSVSEEGRLSPRDSGIYTDKQAEKLKDIVDFFHSQGQNIGVQIGHGGRKASGVPPFVHLEDIATEAAGGWPDKVVAPSALPFRPYGNYKTPIELSHAEVKRIIQDFKSAAKRAVEISGFDFLEIHGAHGYLITEFLSPHSNKRTDEYGGSFDNRIRFLLEIIDEIRSVVPKDLPLFLRVSADENVDSGVSWKLEDTIKLAKIVAKKGIDVLDISSGGNNSNQSRRTGVSQPEMARAIKKEVGDSLLIASVGGHVSGKDTNKYIEEGAFDIALVGKAFLKSPGLVWEWADEFGVRLYQALQYDWAYNLNVGQIIELIEKSNKLSAEKGSD